ncbi:MAG: RecQ family ATP-dependent DNA helicase [Flavobacteriales bacterium]|jgi:ATP-dependent DNA helicase RecQ
MNTVVDLSPREALKQFFGFDQFKGLQEGVISSVLEGHDTFVIMPTGGGKSLCYQLPALMLDGTAIIVSPLIALMKNQVDAMRGFSDEDGVAHVINSSLNKSEITQVKADIVSGKTKLLYVAPESLNKEENIEFLRSVKISFVAIDEAHCISEWGHDFRPEYRRLKPIIQQIADVPVMALTATATPKVQQDIQKNLGMMDARLFKASFNRANLFYEIRPKHNVGKCIIQYIKANSGKSGIIYCLSRKKTEELAELLQVNGIKALPYHAGMDSHQRSSVQDQFLMQDVDVIVATIAFGMGIDKPDVRFVIHHDIPKSLESYYQETGRAGRDGGEGVCVAFYSPKDIEKLEKFLQGKPVAEQEIGMQLLQEVIAYAETSMSRRKYLLHYFGEEWDEVNGEGAGMDDNSRSPKEKFEGKEYVKLLLDTIASFKEMHKAKFICNVICGIKNSEVTTYKGHLNEFFAEGKEETEKFWNAILRQMLVRGLLRKEIETYGTLKITDEGKDFMKKPSSFVLVKEEEIGETDDDGELLIPKQGGGAADETLFGLLKELRLKTSKEKKIPPYVVFQDPALEEMATQYPITIDEISNIGGVGKGKAVKFGAPFIALIKRYVEDNNIERPVDFVVKSAVNKSGHKVQIIQNIDKRIPLPDIAKGLGKDMSELLDELEAIVSSGTKINIKYFIDEEIDEDSQSDIMDYFMQSETDSIEEAMDYFEGDFEEEPLRLMRIKFMSEVGN